MFGSETPGAMLGYNVFKNFMVVGEGTTKDYGMFVAVKF